MKLRNDEKTYWTDLFYLLKIIVDHIIIQLLFHKPTLSNTLFLIIWRVTVGDIYLESYQDGARLQNPELDISALQGLVIIDEIQRMPTLFNVLRVLADRDADERSFLILGSAAQPHNVVI